MPTSKFQELVADRMCVEHRVLATRWFARLLDRIPVEEQDVFPSETLLDHIPELIIEITTYLRHPEEAAISANTAVLAKANELGALRHGQRASLHQVLREYQLLNGVLVNFVLEEMARQSVLPSAPETLRLVSRLHQAVAVLQQATVEAFVTLYTRSIEEQKKRLEQFTRMASHEWRQPLGALQFAVALLRTGTLDPQRAARTVESTYHSVQHLTELTDKLEGVARMREDLDTPMVQQVSVTTVAREAARQLREMAQARGVSITIDEALPVITADVGRLELVFVNLLSNAIKYSDPNKTKRLVTMNGAVVDDTWCRIEVADNGVGIPAAALPTVFHRFTRGHTARRDLSHVGGVGLGLSIVEDCIRDMGGRIELDSVEHQGATFVLTLPMTLAA